MVSLTIGQFVFTEVIRRLLTVGVVLQDCESRSLGSPLLYLSLVYKWAQAISYDYEAFSEWIRLYLPLTTSV